jgi:riboflavin-specific deaminase-like protein
MNPNQQIEEWLLANKQNFQLQYRPFVTLCYAQSLDGSIAIHCGEPLALSCPESLQLTHQLRSMHDGILVGIGTVLSDDPQLNVRHWSGLNPQPIVLDSKLRMPASARLRQLPDKPCWVLTTHEGEALVSEGDVIAGLEITALETNAEGKVCLEQALRLLRAKGINSLMVEGGARVITAFLAAQLVDAVVITLVPRLLGGYKAVSDLGAYDKQQLPEVSSLQSAALGKDIVLWGNLRYGENVV